MRSLWRQLLDWLWRGVIRAERQRAVEYARLALAAHERHRAGRPPLADADLTSAAQCILEWQAVEQVTGLAYAAEAAVALLAREQERACGTP